MKIKLETKKWVNKTSSLFYETVAKTTRKHKFYLRHQTKKIKESLNIKHFLTQSKFNCNVFKQKNKFFSSALSSKQESITEAQLILCYALNINKVQMHCNDNFLISPSENALLDDWVKRRLQGEPLAYIFGSKEFYGLDFIVNANTLIPRPETEHLVDEILDFQNENSKALILDLGCGSGCIGLSVLHHKSDAIALFVDISKDTLNIAKENSKKLNLDKQSLFYCADFTSHNFKEELIDFLKKELDYDFSLFDIIVSNPPYIPAHEYKKLDQTVKKFEPKQALISSDFEYGEGAFHLHKVIQLAENLLKPQGLFLMEHGYNQAEMAIQLCNQNSWEKLETKKDYAGQERYLRGILGNIL